MSEDIEIDWNIVKDTYKFLMDSYSFAKIYHDISNSEALPKDLREFAKNHLCLRHNIPRDSKKLEVYLDAIFRYLKKSCEEDDSEICEVDFSEIIATQDSNESPLKIKSAIEREDDIVLPRIKLKAEFVKKYFEAASRPEGIIGHFFAEAVGEGRMNVLEWGLSKVNINSDNIILDIGFGAGHNINNLAKKVTSGRVYGIDIAEKMVQISTSRNKDFIEMGRVDIKRASVSSMPFEDNMFDLVMSVESINYWINLDIDLKEIYRVLKENGTVLIINNSYKHEKFKEKHKIWMENIPNLTLYTREQFYEYFQRAGFSNIEIITIEDKNWITIAAKKLQDQVNVFPVLKEHNLKEIAIEYDLKFISDYSQFKNIYSTLDWICLRCGTLIHDCYHDIAFRGYGCQNCKKKEKVQSHQFM